MQRFILIRVFHSILALFAVSIIIFGLARLSGDPVAMMLPVEASQEDFDRVRAAWGLDQPLHIQYLTYLGNIARGNFGESIRWKGESALDLVVQRFPATLELAFLSLIVSALIALPIGVMVAVKKDTGVDMAGKVVALLGQSLPSFWLGLTLMWIFAVQLDLLPTAGRGSWRNLVLPAVTLGYFQVAAVMRLTRSSMLEVLDTEFVKLARIKGISEKVVIWKHCLRNALIAPLTYFALILGGFLTGSVVTETVFSYPGIGLLAIDALRARDFQVVQSVVLFFTGLFIFANLVVDILYAYLDPRIRYSH
jgi:peptide/nickel transport system permease protein